MVTERLEITRPDDWHLHLRDGVAMADVLPHTAAVFARAIVMPNLKPPVRTVAEALAYRARIVDALPAGARFEPLMTLYLTPETSPADIEEAAASEHVFAVKLYPAGATTNAQAGVRDLEPLTPVFEAMQDQGVPLLVHGESIDPHIDVFDREAVFLRETLESLVARFDRLKVVVEHITTAEAVAFVESGPSRVGATITAHHLLYNRNEIFRGGLRPHAYCLPVLKRERHRQALVAAATSGNAKFFLGTDSAPHLQTAKETACGCAGCYTAHAALPLYAEAFAAVGALERLEGFASHHGADFYGLPRNTETVVLERVETRVPDRLPFGGGDLIPLRAGETVSWRMRGRSQD